ncbi:MAG TPA: hypothetical protein VGC66_05860 [Pyrinomonadaceae bacterium]|jgi:hypothetical protein
MRKLATILMTAILLSALFTQRVTAQDASGNIPQYALSSAEAKKIVEVRARQVMLALKNRDMQRLSTFVHPRKGVRFSPYVYVDKKNAIVLSRQRVVSLYRSNRRLVWGEQDGSGDPIRMTFRQYFNRFVYRLDLLTNKEVGYNPPDRGGPGTDINNVLENYPRAILVRYAHDGITAPQGGGMDWQQLWLVFEKMGNEWYLVGIVNNEWTI